MIGEGQCIEQPGAGYRVGVQLPDSFSVLPQAKLASGAEQSFRGLAAEFAPLDPEAAGKRGANRRERILLPGGHIRGTANHI